MVPDDRGETGPELFQEIADFWSAQFNKEIFPRGHTDVERGRKYLDIILAARHNCMHYLPRMIGHLQASPDKGFQDRNRWRRRGATACSETMLGVGSKQCFAYQRWDASRCSQARIYRSRGCARRTVAHRPTQAFITSMRHDGVFTG
jgi:hypothetical protein